ncbi:unnamed protein product [Aphanomyces euteiches]
MSMAASVPYFRRHVIVMDAQGNAEAWPKKLEMSDHVLSQYARAIEPLNEATDPKPLGIAAAYPTNAQLSLASQDTHEVLVFPENIRVSNVREGDIEFLTKHLLAESVDIAALEAKLCVTKLTGHHAFVCAHANRDYRCACAGPKLIEWLQTKTPQDWTIYASSHYGGHRFAGNCIVYPEGHWYGMLNKPEDVDKLVQAFTGDGELALESLWRGCTGMTKESQLKLYARATSQ